MKLNYFLSFIILGLLINCSKSSNKPKNTKPKLVIGIIIDQMKYDYLEKFNHRFGENGFNKIIDKGFNIKNGHLNYIPTYTAVGHSSIFTGTTPNYHGIIGNHWYDKTLKKSIYCVDDNTYKTIGSSSKKGQKSPYRLQTTTLGDELHKSQNNRGKVISISLKDRSAILTAGHTANLALWFDGKKIGKWITSSYYMSKLPKWVDEFNDLKLPQQYLTKNWETTYPIESYIGNDSSNSEIPFESKKAPTFPYNLDSLKQFNGNFDLLTKTPYGNSFTTDLTIETIKQEKLGQNDVTDLLIVSYSSTDIIGHQFGPSSIEIEDTYAKLDKEITRILLTLDKTVGEENYTLFLTSDHGVAYSPIHLQEQGIDAGFYSNKSISSKVKQFAFKQFNDSSVIEAIQNNNIYLNQQRIDELTLNKELVSKTLNTFIKDIETIENCFTSQEIIAIQEKNNVFKNGYNPNLSGDIIFSLKPNFIGNHFENGGSTHGSGYDYDTHIPILFYGNGIKKGMSNNYYPITTITPTISKLLKIQPPKECYTSAIIEVLK